jgi:pilus assembly protein FimV
MDISDRRRRPLGSFVRRSWAAWAVLGALAAAPMAQAATFGHARLASAVGQPLVIVVPVTGLTAADLQTLAARPAPAAAWTEAGLTPPVALDTLTVSVAPGPGAKSDRVLRVHSSQTFSGTLADVLLDVRTATGSQRYQVSLIGPGPAQASGSGAGAAGQGGVSTAGTAVGAAPAATSIRRVPMGAIRVRRGDTMFAIGRRHAVEGVSIYQLMLALQRANPQAFIHQNINLVRAGASLAVPGVADMLSISDAEARRQFVAQTAAFNRLRGRQATETRSVQGERASAGNLSAPAESPRTSVRPASHDQVRLSEGGSDRADARTAQGHALKDTESRVDQLQDNVQNLNQALQAQGEAARHVVANGASAVTQSIQKIAGAISQASHEAAAQASNRVEASAAPGTGVGAPSGSAGIAGGASMPGQAGAEAVPAGSGAHPETVASTGPAAAVGAAARGMAGAAAAGTGGPAAGSASTAAGASSATAAAGQARPGAPAASADGHDPLFDAAGDTPASEAKAHANAVAAERHATEQTRHRVNWLQDHLLGVMTGLLALIVFIIAWLLRRANAARDEADADPRVTEAMVQEKLQGIDLDLPATEPDTPTSGA